MQRGKKVGLSKTVLGPGAQKGGIFPGKTNDVEMITEPSGHFTYDK